MLAAVRFHYQPSLGAGEVGDEAGQPHLATEFVAFEPTAPQLPP
jgi:hypothetical protein